MTIALAQALVVSVTNNVPNHTCAFGSAATPGNSIVVGVQYQTGSGKTISSVTITGGTGQTLTSVAGNPQTFTLDTDDEALAFYYLDNITDGGVKTVHVNKTDYFNATFFIAELSGTDNTGCLDAVGTQSTGTSVSPSSPITTVRPNSAIFLLEANAIAGGGASAAGGYTDIALGNLNSYNEGEYLLDAGAAGAKTPTMTIVSSLWYAWAIAIRPPAAAGGFLTKNLWWDNF